MSLRIQCFRFHSCIGLVGGCTILQYLFHGALDSPDALISAHITGGDVGQTLTSISEMNFSLNTVTYES